MKGKFSSDFVFGKKNYQLMVIGLLLWFY